MSTFCPAWIFAFLRKCNADTPPNKTAAASSNVMLAGFIASNAPWCIHKILGMRAELEAGRSKYLVALAEPGHRLAHRLDLSGELHPQYLDLPWLPKSR